MCIHVNDGHRDNSVEILIDRYRMLVSEVTTGESLTHVSICISRIQMRIMLSFIMMWSWKESIAVVYVTVLKYS